MGKLWDNVGNPWKSFISNGKIWENHGKTSINNGNTWENHGGKSPHEMEVYSWENLRTKGWILQKTMFDDTVGFLKDYCKMKNSEYNKDP